jgi:phosphocarrier protein HPr
MEGSLLTIVRLQNKKGLHARAAAKLVAIANKYECSITLSYKNRHANAKNMLEILTLAAPCGEKLIINAQGADAELATAALFALIEDKFGEGI